MTPLSARVILGASSVRSLLQMLQFICFRPGHDGLDVEGLGEEKVRVKVLICNFRVLLVSCEQLEQNSYFQTHSPTSFQKRTSAAATHIISRVHDKQPSHLHQLPFFGSIALAPALFQLYSRSPSHKHIATAASPLHNHHL